MQFLDLPGQGLLQFMELCMQVRGPQPVSRLVVALSAIEGVRQVRRRSRDAGF